MGESPVGDRARGRMPADRSGIEDSAASGTRTAALWALPVLFLTALWLWLAFASGGLATGDWTFPAVACGVIGLGVAVYASYPRRPRQLSLVVLTVLAGYTVWVLLSASWSGSADASIEAAGRTFLYLLIFTLALAFFTSKEARAAFRYLVIAAALALLAVCIARLWTTGSPVALFSEGQFVFPTGRADSAAAIFLIPLWPLLWLASGPEERAPVRGVAIGTATGLVGLALMTQSRSAVWSLAIALVLLFALSPGRVRLLFYIVIPGLLMVYAFPIIDSYRQQWPAMASGGTAARTLTVAVLASGFIGMIVALLEKWIRVTGRMKAIFGIVVLAGCAAGLVYGAMTLTRDTGGPIAWVQDQWEQLAGEPAVDGATAGIPAGGEAQTENGATPATRAAAWNASLSMVRTGSLVGTGADSSSPSTVAAPAGATGRPLAGSLVLRVLSETGIVGGALLFAAMAFAVGGIMWPRTAAGWRATKSALGVRKDRRRRHASAAQETVAPERPVDRYTATRWGRRPVAYGWEMALLAGIVYWFAQANLDPLWQMTGATAPALLMLAAALAATDARARTMWPRLGRRLRRRPAAATQPTAVEKAPPTTGPTDDTWELVAPAVLRRYIAHPSRSRRLRALLPKHRRLQPPGRLSAIFRYCLMVLSVAVVALAVAAYVLVSG